MPDLVNILVRILDSEQNFNGSEDPMITADHGFIQSLGPDFLGFFFAGNFNFSRLCTGCPAVEKMTRNSEALGLDVAIKFVLFFFYLQDFV